MYKTKILAIAPYEGLKNLLDTVAQERNDIEMHCFVSDLYDGLSLAKKLEYQNYDIILSRAGTAKLISEESILPVIDIKLSILDMVRAIELAQGYTRKFAIMGYNTITDIAKDVCEIFKYDTIIKTIHNASDIESILLELKNQGINLIVGDVVTTTHSKRFGFNTILITTGKESVINAIDEAVQLNSLIRKIKNRNSIIEKIFENINQLIVCLNEENHIIYCNEKKFLRDYSKLISDLKKCKDILIREQNLNIIKKYNNLFFIIKGVLIEHNNKRYFAYYVNRKTNSVKVIDQAIRFINKNEAPQISIDTFSARSENFQNLIDKTKSYAPLKTPILIIGARGTGKDSIAYTIYRNSMFHKNPFIVIDAKYISNQKWVELLESEDSLFLNNGYCIYIKNIHLLNESSQKMFESYLVSSNLHKRNKLIFSTIKEASHSLDNNCLLYFIKNKMHALSIVVPELNQRREDIPNLISLYISEYNSLYGKQVIGLEDDAKALLQDFNWVGNIDQLKRVVQELVVLAETSYIDYDTVKNVLKDEVPHSETPRVYNINLNNTLDKITSDIIGIVLKEENYNQSRASKRLGISRSTLWRKLKENQ